MSSKSHTRICPVPTKWLDNTLKGLAFGTSDVQNETFLMLSKYLLYVRKLGILYCTVVWASLWFFKPDSAVIKSKCAELWSLSFKRSFYT